MTSRRHCTFVILYPWLQKYGVPANGSADLADPDADGMDNWQDWRCGTDPASPNMNGVSQVAWHIELSIIIIAPPFAMLGKLILSSFPHPVCAR